MKTTCVPALLLGTLTIAPGAIRHDVPDAEYRRLAEEPQYRSAALLLDDGTPEASAVLVDPRWVLTAGHEVDAVSSLDRLGVRIGEEEFGVAELVRHPEYRDGVLGHGVDLALLRLSRPAGDVPPARLYRRMDEIGRTGTTVGFGVSGTSQTVITDPQPTGTLRAGRNVIDQAGGRIDDREFPDNLLIADFDSPADAGLNRIGDAAPLPLEYLPLGGDSGGGLFFEVDGTHYLAGIVSAATPRIGDGPEDGLYGSLVYWVRLSLNADWIDEVVERR